MDGSLTRRAAGAALALLAGTAALTGCSDDDSPSSTVSKAASAVESAASRATDAWASATAEAGRKFDEIKNGTDAKDDVEVAAPSVGSDGRATAQVTVANDADSAKSFAVQVDFKDKDGNFRDAVVVTVSDVPAGKEKTATARSNRKLDAEVRAEVSRAVRY
ncbi:hypothetical protein ACIQ6Y_14270 [Streptomyces sp. NPDC096205]|uniref:hypothetical protein n=1 Tax=Streptomyces sp. NPDC096205 TaxID=3366081 RepID=UPI0037F330FD